MDDWQNDSEVEKLVGCSKALLSYYGLNQFLTGCKELIDDIITFPTINKLKILQSYRTDDYLEVEVMLRG